MEGNLFRKRFRNFLRNDNIGIYVCKYLFFNEMEHYVAFTYQPFKILLSTINASQNMNKIDM